MYKTIWFVILLLLAGCVYDYEVCNQNQCNRVQIERIVQPSIETTQLCNPDYLSTGAKSECESVPNNRLLSKGGTDKKYCNDFYNPEDFVDNWWNSEGLIDECEMPVGSNMQFIFKQHDQSIRSHNGVIQVRVDLLNYQTDFKSLQVFAGEDNNKDNLPDDWKHCGNVDELSVKTTRYIQCKGSNLKFIKLVNPVWNKGNLYLDYVEVLKV